eukprot:426587-Hanusia_phi.AAC.1
MPFVGLHLNTSKSNEDNVKISQDPSSLSPPNSLGLQPGFKYFVYNSQNSDVKLFDTYLVSNPEFDGTTTDLQLDSLDDWKRLLGDD